MTAKDLTLQTTASGDTSRVAYPQGATPAPWRITEHPGSHNDNGSNPYTLYGIEAGRMLPGLYPDDRSWDTAEFTVVEVSADRDYYYPEGGIKTKGDAHLIAQSPALLAALKALYEETADYIRINNLGDVHHNHSMQMAREVILAAEGSDRP